jgi:hypothetical protein
MLSVDECPASTLRLERIDPDNVRLWQEIREVLRRDDGELIAQEVAYPDS